MKRFPLCATAAALCLFPALALADPLLSFGPDVPLFLTVTGSVRRDGNVFLSSQNAQADTVYLITPGLDFHWTGGKASLGIAASEQFSRYQTNRELDDHLANIASSFAYAGTDVKLSAAASYQEEDQSSLNLQSSDQTVKHSLAAASGNGEFQVFPKTSVGVGVAFTRTVYPEAGYTNSDEWSLPVDVYYAVTPKTDVSVGYRYDKTIEAGNVDNSKDEFFNVGVRGEITPKLSGQVRVGVTTYSPETGMKSRNLGLSANLDYVLSPKTTIDLNSSSGFDTSPLGSGEKVFTVGLSAISKLSEAWALNLGGSYVSTNYLITPERKDGFYVANAGLNYIWTSNISFQLDYVYRKNRSTLALATFDDNVLTFSVAARF
jgi:hypothetical protein